MADVLFAWIGRTDLQAAGAVSEAGLGPIAQAVEARAFGRVVLISDWSDDDTLKYEGWLRQRGAADLRSHRRPLPNGPMDFGAVYQAAKDVVDKEAGGSGGVLRPVFHLSPGSPAMAAVWILLGKTLYDAELIESSKAHGVRVAEIPFDIAAEFAPAILRKRDLALERVMSAEAPQAPEFSDIIYRSPAMSGIVAMAQRIAPRSVTVLIEGESGTGKELLARAIHRASGRAGAFVAVNCGAIPSELAESELFGHRKGAFTGASSDRMGQFEGASGGTIFLDEIGELPLNLQVKLLRVLQQREVVRIGETAPRPIDVRVIAATNRSLTREVAEGRFREDLFYRLAVAVLDLPPLRGRAGDLGLLLTHLLEQINDESAGDPGFPKTLSVGARKLLLQHDWPGNVRELENTLRRAAIWSAGAKITPEEVRAALLPSRGSRGDKDILDQPLGNGFDLQALLDRVARTYLQRALHSAGGNKSRAAELVGLGSYQTVTNWMKRLGIQS